MATAASIYWDGIGGCWKLIGSSDMRNKSNLGVSLLKRKGDNHQTKQHINNRRTNNDFKKVFKCNQAEWRKE